MAKSQLFVELSRPQVFSPGRCPSILGESDRDEGEDEPSNNGCVSVLTDELESRACFWFPPPGSQKLCSSGSRSAEEVRLIRAIAQYQASLLR
jgi:hypothetical protein